LTHIVEIDFFSMALIKCMCVWSADSCDVGEVWKELEGYPRSLACRWLFQCRVHALHTVRSRAPLRWQTLSQRLHCSMWVCSLLHQHNMWFMLSFIW